MRYDPLSQRIEKSPTGIRLCAAFLTLLAESKSEENFLRQAIAILAKEFKTDIALVAARRGIWRTISQSRELGVIPNELLSDVLDSQEATFQGQFQAIPVESNLLPGELLVIMRNQRIEAVTLDASAAALAQALILARQHFSLHSRVTRLGTMLEMTQVWSQSRETAALLHAMAEKATKLLDAERATIFMWDKTAKELIGRPALGVASGELRIPENSGVVGRAIQTGEPQRVDADVAAEVKQIDRATDRKLDFRTRSLLCVPLRDSRKNIIGAFELINKRAGNFNDADQTALEEISQYAAIAIENTKYIEQIDSTRKQVAEAAADKVQLIGECPEIKKIVQTVKRLAPTDLAVLILGENGTGKEVVAQLIHYNSLRRHNVMVAVNCAAIAESLLESELFGHERGAFTDAREMRKGKFEIANGGSLFLDEIGDMSLSGQAKLLRVLEDKVVVRIGGSVPISTDVRVIAATNQNLEAAVNNKKFRQDLYFRLNVVTILLPPLRERGEDILLLAEHFLKAFSKRASRQIPEFTSAAKKRLLNYHWPGNVRELRNQMERLSYLHSGDKIDVSDLVLLDPPASQQSGIPQGLSLSDATRVFQADYIDRQIQATNGNMTDAAEKLGLHRSNLYRKMKHLGMEVNEFDS
ncbi:MAG TPA: sigma-54-dependent Fis family transcriptional regulator [Pirellulaceae bacterium]|nr:sigma-54-dependent Fis family transcriptional regulator [Pirellulaceae bacterium]HMO91732.1 sigma-54-dependent Fis family transcriptional regulator [Pirellulaceae bacterium]HMP69805.1 sigma-54-dependent Fis family transcriptional regulator [Pirellulaceae bacterium]